MSEYAEEGQYIVPCAASGVSISRRNAYSYMDKCSLVLSNCIFICHSCVVILILIAYTLTYVLSNYPI